MYYFYVNKANFTSGSQFIHIKLTYIGMSTRHWSTRAKEHLDINSQVSSVIKNHIMCCNVCSSVKLNLNSFKIIKKRKSEFHTKIHEALFIKKHNPGLNRQLYANVF